MIYTGPKIQIRPGLWFGPFSPDAVNWLVEMVRSWPWAMDDRVARDPWAFYMGQAARVDSFFLTTQMDGRLMGCVHLSGIQPGHTAWLHAYATHGTSPFVAAACIRRALKLSFTRFDLRRIGTVHAAANKSAGAIVRRAGFVFEGVQRGAGIFDNNPQDMAMFGVLRDEFNGGE